MISRASNIAVGVVDIAPVMVDRARRWSFDNCILAVDKGHFGHHIIAAQIGRDYCSVNPVQNFGA